MDHFLRAKVELADGTFAITRALGGRVKNASTTADATSGGAAITFASGGANPQAGTWIEASNPLPSAAVDGHFGWQHCPHTASPHTDCMYIPNSWCDNYTPTAADQGSYLRMYAYYETQRRHMDAQRNSLYHRRRSAITPQV